MCMFFKRHTPKSGKRDVKIDAVIFILGDWYSSLSFPGGDGALPLHRKVRRWEGKNDNSPREKVDMHTSFQLKHLQTKGDGYFFRCTSSTNQQCLYSACFADCHPPTKHSHTLLAQACTAHPSPLNASTPRTQYYRQSQTSSCALQLCSLTRLTAAIFQISQWKIVTWTGQKGQI